MISASIRRAIDGTYRVTFPYDPDVVAGIKELVPPHSRTYDPVGKSWFVASAYRDIVHELLEAVFIEVETDPERTFTPPTRTTPRTEFHVLHLQPTAPLELVEAAYRCLSRLHHPDRGGSVEIMQQINAAVSIIRSKVS